jgi:hypothetical protein
MPLSPNAPDYVSQVRGFLNDLRQDARQRQQLDLEAYRATSANALGYAQLAAQQDNNAAQRDLQYRQLENQQLQYATELEKYRLSQSQKSFSDDLAERRLQFDMQKEAIKAQEEARKRQLEENSSVMQAELEIAYDSGDPEKIMAANQRASGILQSSAATLAAQKAAKEAVNTKRAMEQESINLRTNDQVYGLAAQLQQTPVQLLTANELQGILSNAQQSYASLGNSDPDARKYFMDSIKNLNNQFKTARSDKSQQNFRNFYQIGLLNGLKDADPEVQEKFNAILQAYPTDVRPTSAAFQDEITQLGMQFNKRNSDKWIDITNQQNQNMLAILKQRFPDIAIEEPPVMLKDFIGEDGHIDPLDGTITTAARKENEAWRNRTKARYAPNDPIEALISGAVKPGAPAAAPAAQTVQTAPAPARATSPFAKAGLDQQAQTLAETLVLANPSQMINVKRKDGTSVKMSVRDYADERFAELGGYAGLLNYRNLKTNGTSSGNVAGAKE